MRPLRGLFPGLVPWDAEPQGLGRPREGFSRAGSGQGVEDARDRGPTGQAGGDEVAGQGGVSVLVDRSGPREDPAAQGDADHPGGRAKQRTDSPDGHSRIELPGRGAQGERAHDSDEGKRGEDSRGHEGTGGGDAARFRDGLGVIDTVPDGVEDVGHGRAEAVAESAGQGDGGGGATSGRVWGPGVQGELPPRRLSRPFVEDGRVGRAFRHDSARADAREGVRPGSPRRRSRAQPRRHLGDQEGELARLRHAAGAPSMPPAFSPA